MSTIAKVETEILPDPANPQLLVHVTDTEGQTGVGETWWGHYRPDLAPGAPVVALAAIIDSLLAPTCVGATINTTDDIKALWQGLIRSTYQYGDEGMVRTAISGIDIALWDLIGRRRDVPVTDMLGPVSHDRLPVYASLDWRNDVDSIYADSIRALEAGFAAIKLHESDAAIINGVRNALGPEVTLMVDASAAHDERGAIDLAAAVAGANLTWLEEPVRPQRDHEALARVSAAATMVVAAGENEFSAEGFERLLSTEAVGMVQPEIAKFGGLTPAGEIAELAAHHSVPLSPHNFSMGPSFLASWHWAMTEPGAAWLEVPWLPDGAFPCGLELPSIDTGTIGVPSGPGLGMPERQR